jgi:hypothetical protein
LSVSAGRASDTERQGILVSEAARDQAEEECLADSELRAFCRERDSKRRAEQDQNLVAEMARDYRVCFPVARPQKREPSRSTRRGGAADESGARLQAGRWKKKR